MVQGLGFKDTGLENMMDRYELGAKVQGLGFRV